jgi:hypothetical protein
LGLSAGFAFFEGFSAGLMLFESFSVGFGPCEGFRRGDLFEEAGAPDVGRARGPFAARAVPAFLTADVFTTAGLYASQSIVARLGVRSSDGLMAARGV